MTHSNVSINIFVSCLKPFNPLTFRSLGEHDYINVNGSGSIAAAKLEEDTCDHKTNKQKSELYSNNSNNTRTLTQQSSLVAPSEVHVSISPALTAEPVLTPNGMFDQLHLII